MSATRKYDIAQSSAPTMQLFKGGAGQATQIGLVSKSQLTKAIDSALGNGV